MNGACSRIAPATAATISTGKSHIAYAQGGGPPARTAPDGAAGAAGTVSGRSANSGASSVLNRACIA